MASPRAPTRCRREPYDRSRCRAAGPPATPAITVSSPCTAAGSIRCRISSSCDGPSGSPPSPTSIASSRSVSWSRSCSKQTYSACARCGDVAGDLQRDGGLAGARRAAEDHQVSRVQAPAQVPVHRRQPGRPHRSTARAGSQVLVDVEQRGRQAVRSACPVLPSVPPSVVHPASGSAGRASTRTTRRRTGPRRRRAVRAQAVAPPDRACRRRPADAHVPCPIVRRGRPRASAGPSHRRRPNGRCGARSEAGGGRERLSGCRAALAHGDHDRLRPVGDPELVVHLRDVRLHRRLRQVQTLDTWWTERPSPSRPSTSPRAG